MIEYDTSFLAKNNRKKNNIPNLLVVVFIKGANAEQADDTSKEQQIIVIVWGFIVIVKRGKISLSLSYAVGFSPTFSMLNTSCGRYPVRIPLEILFMSKSKTNDTRKNPALTNGTDMMVQKILKWIKDDNNDCGCGVSSLVPQVR